MRIVELKAENIKRLSAVDITPAPGGLVVIAGRNAQGKSSVLDAIAMALGGTKLAPKQPIRKGASRGEVTVDLGDYVVTRTFMRDQPLCDCTPEPTAAAPSLLEDPPPGVAHTQACASLTLAPVRTVLKVKSKEGATFPSPQALLDKLVGELAFDPLAFLKMKEADQDATLRRLAGVDTSAIERRRVATFEERTTVNRNHKALEARLAALPATHADAPADIITVEALNDEIQAAAQLRETADAARGALAAARGQLLDAQSDAQNLEREIAVLEERLEHARVRLRNAHDDIAGADRDAATALRAFDAAAAAVPNTEAIQAKLRAADTTNRKVRENHARAALEADAVALAAKRDALTADIATADTEKAAALAAAKFPVDGLALSDDGPTFNGQLLAQASTSERLRVSVSMGLALNPKLKVLLVHEGNDLDDDGLALLAAIAGEHDAQVWLERIAGAGDGVSIVIEDGAVKA